MPRTTNAVARRKRRKKGKLDLHTMLRRNAGHGGVPFELIFKERRKDRPKLVILCDVSSSVANVSRFMLQFVYSLQECFTKIRAFVFVAELGEVTQTFHDHDVSKAIELDGVYGTLIGEEVAAETDPFFQIAPPPGGDLKDYALAVGRVVRSRGLRIAPLLDAIRPWSRTTLAAVLSIASILIWGLLTGHGVGALDPMVGIGPFDPVWGEAVFLTVLGGGVLLAAPVALPWIRRQRKVGVTCGGLPCGSSRALISLNDFVLPRSSATTSSCERFGRLLHPRLDHAAVSVQAIEFHRDRARLRRVGRGQQAHAQVRAPDAPAGVDPGPEGETEVAAARRLR